jgi:hypothetical protein
MPRRKYSASIVPTDSIQSRILLIRGQRVIIDADLAVLYSVSTKALNQQLKRNPLRFPGDFVFRLTPAEKREVVTNCDHLQKLKFSPQLPFAFTEHGTLMADNVLSSDRAIAASVFVVRAFVKLRELLSTHRQLADKLAELEHKLHDHDGQILAIMDAIRQLMEPPDEPETKRPPVGFHTEIALPPGGP